MLTPAQSKLLALIHTSITKDGVAPSVRELMASSGVKSTSAVHDTLRLLEERGFIRRMEGKSRAIEVLRPPPSMGGACPTCGAVREAAE